MAKKTPPSEYATLPAVGDSPILRGSTRAADRTFAPPAAVAAAADEAESPSSFDTDQATDAHMATDDAPSKRNAVQVKKAPTKNARAKTVMAPPPPVF